MDSLKDYEVIYIDNINEARVKAGGNISGKNTVAFAAANISQDLTPFNRLTAAGPGTPGTMGGYVRSALSLGTGYGVQVSDFGEVCTINITYSNAKTGRTAGQNFAIIYRPEPSKWAYTAYSCSSKWRNCTSIDQAVSFIKSKASALAGSITSAI